MLSKANHQIEGEVALAIIFNLQIKQRERGDREGGRGGREGSMID